MNKPGEIGDKMKGARINTMQDMFMENLIKSVKKHKSPNPPSLGNDLAKSQPKSKK